MAKATQKKAPHGDANKKSFDKAKESKAAGGLGKLHKGGRTVPLFNAERIDKLESSSVASDKSAKH